MPSPPQLSRILLLLSGNSLAQLIAIATVPVLAHLYSPADFGILASVVSLVSLSAVVVHGRYHMAIPVSRDEDESIALFALAALLSIALAPVAVLSVVFLVGQSVGEESFYFIAGSAVVLTVATALIDVFAYWRSHRLRFKASARNAVARAAVTAVAQIGFGPATSAGLIGGTLAGAVVALALCIRDVVCFDSQRLVWPSWSRIGAAARRYSGHPLFGVPQGLIAAGSWNALPLLLLHFSGAAAAGQYWLAYRLIIAPVTVFNGAYRQATLPAMGRGDLSVEVGIARQHSIILLISTGTAATIIYFFGETLFAVLLGEEWRQAGAVAAWLGIGLTADVAKIPAMCLLQSRAGHRVILAWEAAIVVVRYSAILPFLRSGDVITAVAIFSLVGFTGWVLFSAYCFADAAKLEIGEAKGEG